MVLLLHLVPPKVGGHFTCSAMGVLSERVSPCLFKVNGMRDETSKRDFLVDTRLGRGGGGGGGVETTAQQGDQSNHTTDDGAAKASRRCHT